MYNIPVINKMPAESKDKWLAALRSGDYKQGTGCLYSETDNSYCCLGVLQHCLTGEVEHIGNTPAALPSSSWSAKQNIKFGISVFDIETDIVPWFTIANGDKRTAPWLNDVAKLSFNEIADLIETQVEGI